MKDYNSVNMNQIVLFHKIKQCGIKSIFFQIRHYERKKRNLRFNANISWWNTVKQVGFSFLMRIYAFAAVVAT